MIAKIFSLRRNVFKSFVYPAPFYIIVFAIFYINSIYQSYIPSWSIYITSWSEFFRISIV